eukprot:7846110-Prorocentrum_lima.AAC.1
MADIDNRFSFMLLKCLPEKMRGRVFGETDGGRGTWGWMGTGGTAELDQICERPWGCQRSRRGTEGAENLENSTEKRTRSGNSSF